MMFTSVNGVPATGVRSNEAFTSSAVSNKAQTAAGKSQTADNAPNGRKIKLEIASETAKNLFQRLVNQPLQQIKKVLVKSFSQAPERLTQLFRQQKPSSTNPTPASSSQVQAPQLGLKDQEPGSLVDNIRPVQKLQSKPAGSDTKERVIFTDDSTFNGRSATDDKTKALLDVVSHLSGTDKGGKYKLSSEQRQQLAEKFFSSQLSFTDVRQIAGKSKKLSATDLQWLRKLATSSPTQLLGNELASKKTEFGIVATGLKHFVANTDKQWAEKNKENPEDQLDAVKRNQFLVGQLEQHVSQLPQATIDAVFQKTTGPEGAQWRGVFDFATAKLSLSEELMETKDGQVLISLPTKLTAMVENLAAVTAKQLGKEAPIALAESNWIDSVNSLSKTELAALEGIGVKKNYLDD